MSVSLDTGGDTTECFIAQYLERDENGTETLPAWKRDVEVTQRLNKHMLDIEEGERLAAQDSAGLRFIG